MAQHLALSGVAGGTRSELLKAVSEPSWTVEKGLVGASRDDVEDAITFARYSMQPLKEIDPELRGSKAKEVINALGEIGMKVAPSMPDDQAQRWRVAMLKALSDLPPKVAVQAAVAAMHVPMRFLNEVELAVREKAVEFDAAQKVAMVRLEALLRAIENAAKPVLPAAEIKPLSAQEIRNMPAEYRKFGITIGAITQEEVDAALGEGNGQEEEPGAALPDAGDRTAGGPGEGQSIGASIPAPPQPEADAGAAD